MKRLLTTSLLVAGVYGLTLLAGTLAASAETPGAVANADPSCRVVLGDRGAY
jgi:hypothetical protein